MELETINKLYLELSQIATAKTKRELALEAALEDTLDFVERHSNRWDGAIGKHPTDVVMAARELLGHNAQ